MLYHVVFFAKGKPGARLCLRNRSRFSFFHFLSPFYHHDNSINVAASFEIFFIIQLIHSMLKNSSHSIQKLSAQCDTDKKLSPPETISIRVFWCNRLCNKKQDLLDSISSTCTFRFSSVFLSCFSFLYLSKKKIHNFRSPETQTESKSGKIQMKTNSLHTIAGLRT